MYIATEKHEEQEEKRERDRERQGWRKWRISEAEKQAETAKGLEKIGVRGDRCKLKQEGSTKRAGTL